MDGFNGFLERNKVHAFMLLKSVAIGQLFHRLRGRVRISKKPLIFLVGMNKFIYYFFINSRVY